MRDLEEPHPSKHDSNSLCRVAQDVSIQHHYDEHLRAWRPGRAEETRKQEKRGENLSTFVHPNIFYVQSASTDTSQPETNCWLCKSSALKTKAPSPTSRVSCSTFRRASSGKASEKESPRSDPNIQALRRLSCTMPPCKHTCHVRDPRMASSTQVH